MLSNCEQFYLIHRNLIVKAIEELQFEEILKPIQDGPEYKLQIGDNLLYIFKGTIGAWGNLHVDASSLKKFISNKQVMNYTMNSFFKEIQHICGMSGDTLSKFLEEGNQTIFSDFKVYENLEQTQMSELFKLDYEQIDRLLPAHPKLIMNKGRIGWGGSEILKYAPEYGLGFKLRWVAAHKSILEYGISESVDNVDLTLETLDKELIRDIDTEEHLIFPVHPWQWDRYIQIQFAEEICTGKIIDLGEVGQEYTPQISIRTLSQKKAKSSFDIKQSLSILNTSCVRGIPSKYIKIGYKISEFVQGVVEQDEFLADRVDVLKEVAAIRVKNQYFDDIENSSYRYKELLGVVWREAVRTKLHSYEKAIPTAALFCKNSETSFISELINESGISPQQWISRYFQSVVIPLYHLQVKHGLGLVSHGQNVILVLKDNVPSRLIIKDFHGDLRISSKSIHVNEGVCAQLDKLAPEHLIHDLITGHFITVLRYVSRVLKDHNVMDEKTFYGILGHMIQRYKEEVQVEIPSELDLMRTSFEKVLVNKVRFLEGYSELPVRPVPRLGSLIENPIKRYSL
ncbi:MAG: hypothetical protein KC478_08190 [Bacteriovoracaceae bacterium]|nr:hypothetical protein [Bacteriovoracaceae bacterium]